MKILAITLARGGSKSVKNKNIRQLAGIPLIAHTINATKKSKFITDYIVSTDSKEIAKTAKEYGASVPFLRPEELAADTSTSVSALKHAVDFMEKQNKITYDIVVETMCTNPLKTTEDVDSCIKKIIETGADSVIAVNQLWDHHPARIKKIENDLIVDFFPEPSEARRQDLKPEAYIRSGSIYVMQRDYLMVKGLRYGGSNSRPYILDEERAVNIDTEMDFKMAEMLFNNS
jgi:CMP-N,N'-diacetyllegionaminic acid synthase